MANDNLRDRAIAESERNISYLNEQAAKTDVVGIRQTIYNIMETEINKAMLAKGSEEYAFKLIDPAVVPQKTLLASSAPMENCVVCSEPF